MQRDRYRKTVQVFDFPCFPFQKKKTEKLRKNVSFFMKLRRISAEFGNGKAVIRITLPIAFNPTIHLTKRQ
jgi:hypothetical protein